jgi:hypothetical protein
MSHTPIRKRPAGLLRMPIALLRLPQMFAPEAALGAATLPRLLARVSELPITADSTWMNAWLPPPSSSPTKKRMLEPAPSRTRSCEATLKSSVVADATFRVAPLARTWSHMMLIVPPIVTVVCASAAGAPSAAATATAITFLFIVSPVLILPCGICRHSPTVAA